MAEDEYESLPDSTMSTHMLAGAAAGMMEHCIMYPVDCVKTRMQCLLPDPKASYRNVADAFYRIVRYESIWSTMRGINATIYGAGPAHALYFACYEKMKESLSRTTLNSHISHGIAGCCATVLHDAIMNPAEVVKQRMQVYCSPYRSCLDCMRTVYRQESVVAFYRSCAIQLSMNVPFASIHFMTYELSQDIVNRDRHYNPPSHMLSGAIAGAVAAAVTTPLDVCKTLLNTQERCVCIKGETSSISGLSQAVRAVYQFRGFAGFFSGLTARVIYQMPSTAISWSVYEFFKYFITKQKAQGKDKFIGSKTVGSVQVHAASAE